MLRTRVRSAPRIPGLGESTPACRPRTRRSGHGVLEINPLVTFKVLFQCKRYGDGSVVTPSQVRDFRGAMMGRADKGLILTTGSFTSEARKEATRDGVPPIELVDETKLVMMFERAGIGLRPRQTYEVDVAFFDEFRS